MLHWVYTISVIFRYKTTAKQRNDNWLIAAEQLQSNLENWNFLN